MQKGPSFVSQFCYFSFLNILKESLSKFTNMYKLTML